MASNMGWPKGRCPRGYTLMEVTIASALLLLLMASCTSALRTALQYQRRINEQSEMEKSLILAVESLFKDGSETSSPSISFSATAPEGPSLTFAIPRGPGGELLIDHDNGNKLLFGSMVSYRVTGDDKEFRRYIDFLDTPIGLAPHPIKTLEPPHDASFYAQPTIQYRPLAKGVVDFSLNPIALNNEGKEVTMIEDSDGNKVAVTVETSKILRIRLGLERRFQRTYGVSMELNIVPRN